MQRAEQSRSRVKARPKQFNKQQPESGAKISREDENKSTKQIGEGAVEWTVESCDSCLACSVWCVETVDCGVKCGDCGVAVLSSMAFPGKTTREISHFHEVQNPLSDGDSSS